MSGLLKKEEMLEMASNKRCVCCSVVGQHRWHNFYSQAVISVLYQTLQQRVVVCVLQSNCVVGCVWEGCHARHHHHIWCCKDQFCLYKLSEKLTITRSTHSFTPAGALGCGLSSLPERPKLGVELTQDGAGVWTACSTHFIGHLTCSVTFWLGQIAWRVCKRDGYMHKASCL